MGWTDLMRWTGTRLRRHGREAVVQAVPPSSLGEPRCGAFDGESFMCGQDDAAAVELLDERVHADGATTGKLNGAGEVVELAVRLAVIGAQRRVTPWRLTAPWSRNLSVSAMWTVGSVRMLRVP